MSHKSRQYLNPACKDQEGYRLDNFRPIILRVCWRTEALSYHPLTISTAPGWSIELKSTYDLYNGDYSQVLLLHLNNYNALINQNRAFLCDSILNGLLCLSLRSPLMLFCANIYRYLKLSPYKNIINRLVLRGHTKSRWAESRTWRTSRDECHLQIIVIVSPLLVLHVCVQLTRKKLNENWFHFHNADIYIIFWSSKYILSFKKNLSKDI